jgi:membrane-associated phospholipid phosphatase
MKQFFQTLPGNIIRCFKGWMMVWHVAAIRLTFILVDSGFDGWFFNFTNNADLKSCMFWAARIGFFVPIILPPSVLFYGAIFKKGGAMRLGFAITQSEILGSVISSTYKAFTGRAHPPLHDLHPAADASRVFHFGLLQGGVFWGWPSSHTTIAFAMAGTVWGFFPRKRWLGIAAFIYALYIGVGVGMTIHWFSDFVAGAIIGSVIGAVVPKSFTVAIGGNGENKN